MTNGHLGSNFYGSELYEFRKMQIELILEPFASQANKATS